MVNFKKIIMSEAETQSEPEVFYWFPQLGPLSTKFPMSIDSWNTLEDGLKHKHIITYSEYHELSPIEFIVILKQQRVNYRFYLGSTSFESLLYTINCDHTSRQPIETIQLVSKIRNGISKWLEQQRRTQNVAKYYEFLRVAPIRRLHNEENHAQKEFFNNPDVLQMTAKFL